MPTNTQLPKDGAAQVKDPGAEDNLLSLDPNDPNWAEEIAEWEDGQEYDLDVKVRQISPGQFEVLQAVPKSESPAEEENEPETPTPPPRTGGPKVRKAVSQMMMDEGA
jgi:hypothetical protein